ncbi:MAG: cell division protein SepF [Acutalibacteraceae bacterium]|nr:cell division protein SepF [Acutalibacteraceae bacterium]
MGLWDSIKNIMTIPDDDEFEDEVTEKAERPQSKAQDDGGYTSSKKSESTPKIIKSKTISYSQNQSSLQVVLVKPERFEEVTTIADHLNDGKTVVLNLEETPRDVQRRVVDFLSGVAYANGGNMRKVAKNTFIIVARGVDVMGELMVEDFEDGKIYF